MILVGVCVASCAPQPASRAWPQVEDLQGRQVNALDPDARATVLVFIRHDCPLANRYVPEIERLRAAYEPRSVAFRSIYLDAKESPELIAAHRRAYQISLPAFRDPLHRLAFHVGAKVTPEVSLVAADGRIVYGGRIDDRVDGILRQIKGLGGDG